VEAIGSRDAAIILLWSVPHGVAKQWCDIVSLATVHHVDDL
jgi:hypothetical protein